MTQRVKAADAPSFDCLVVAAKCAERAGRTDEALVHYEAALRQMPQHTLPATACELLRAIATLHRECGDLDTAADVCDAYLAVAEANDLPQQVAMAVNFEATIELLRGRLDAAEALYDHSRSIAADAGSERVVALVEQNLGIVANIRGDADLSLRRYSSALDGFRAAKDEVSALRTLNNLGMLHKDRCAWSEAERCYDEAMEAAVRLQDEVMVGTVELNRAALYLKRQWFEQARDACERALVIFTRSKARSRLGEAYKQYGVLYRETGRLDLAEVHFSLAFGLAGSTQHRLLEAELHSEWAVALLEAERYSEAVKRLNQAHEIYADMRARRELIDVERRLLELRNAYLPAVQMWGSPAVEAKDCFLLGHTRRVADYSGRLGARLGLKEWDLTWLTVGALVHDVGKTAVPSDVLQKGGSANAAEQRLLESHAVVGHAMVEALRFPQAVRQMVRNHHERWDGTGYPDRLAGSDIPLPTRILTIANRFDSLTTARRHRPAREAGEALSIMQSDAGRIFDAELFSEFSELISAGGG